MNNEVHNQVHSHAARSLQAGRHHSLHDSHKTISINDVLASTHTTSIGTHGDRPPPCHYAATHISQAMNAEKCIPYTSLLPITLCLIVRDEADVIGRCLASAVPLVREIIVVDTGSIDDTPHIAAAYGAAVHYFTWADDFAAARNASIVLAHEPWILVLDADEIMEPESWQAGNVLPLLLQDRVHAYYVRCVHLAERWHIGQPCPDSLAVDMACRLFRNDPRFRFQGCIHEEIAASVQTAYPDGLQWAPLTLWHDGYAPEVLRLKHKSDRNRQLLLKQLQEYPNDPLWWYAYGTELFQDEQYEECLPWLMRTLSIMTEKADIPGYMSDVWLKSVYALQMTGQIQKALELAQLGNELYPNFPDLLELHAYLLGTLNRFEEAYNCAHKATCCGNIEHLYTTTEGAGGWRSHWAAACMAERLHRSEVAARHYEEAAKGFKQPAIRMMLTAATAAHRNDFHTAINNMLLVLDSIAASPIAASVAHVHAALSTLYYMLQQQLVSEPHTDTQRKLEIGLEMAPYIRPLIK
ncbi:glycosyltransferase [Paenibacillus sp. ACRRX]|uniref:glycosyltransferase n=1 Tax=Paenibacillus sp. ACRRX TaxID=2918206 RepID=UPI001EF644BD|nr:glycosyltransferase [Paenibacillus sp. ACRRX]MCG7408653.1 glycosyltransferase [Paenibacillus sp. ACRRX]